MRPSNKERLDTVDYLLYLDLCNAINSGDVGHVEESFISWIYMFYSIGKT